MKIHRSALIVFGAGLVLMARMAVVNDFEIRLSPSPTPDNTIFDADRTTIPAGGCVTLSWVLLGATRIVLRGSNWPPGTQEGVATAGSTVVCPSAATHYVPNDPVEYSLMATYADGHAETHEIVIRYEGMGEVQPLPSATFDPHATPAGIPVTPDTNVPAVFQTFENGWMLWRGDTNTVFILLGDGALFSYSSDSIQPVQIRETIPLDRFEPHELLAGVWRSWIGTSIVSTFIGWPTAPAQTYTARVFGQITFGFGMTLPDGRYVGINSAGAWYMSGITGGNWTVSGSSPTFMPPSYPTLTPTATPRPTLLGAIYQPFEHGFMVWREDQNCVYAYAEGNIIIPQQVRAVNDISSSYHYCQEVANLPDEAISDSAPPGLINPVGALKQVWNFYPDVREVLGYATEPEQHYISSIPPAPIGVSGAPWEEPVLGLPDGRVLWCGFRSATSGMCSLHQQGE